MTTCEANGRWRRINNGHGDDDRVNDDDEMQNLPAHVTQITATSHIELNEKTKSVVDV